MGAGILLVAAFAFAFLIAYLRVHALPGSSVGGVQMGGKTQAQARATLQQMVDEQLVTVEHGEGEEEVFNIGDTGVLVDADGTVEALFAPNRSVPTLIRGLFSGGQIDPVITVDQDMFASFAGALLPAEQVQPINAEVLYDADLGAYYTKESRPGEVVDTEKLLAELDVAATSLVDTEISVPTKVSEPKVETEHGLAAAELANKFLNADLSVTDSYWDVASPSHSDRLDWITFSGEGTEYGPHLNAKAVHSWVQEFADESSDAPVTGLRNVDADGNELAISLPARDGYGVNNVDEVVEAFSGALAGGTGAQAVFTYSELPATWEDRPALEGTEDLPYRPAAGEKWLDLNLTDNTVTAYEGAEIVGGPWYIVPGEPRTPTVTGEFNVYLKYEIQDMRGENVDGSKYLTKDVPWVTYFYGGYAFHGAPWRSSFGWSGPGGSHGCVNMEPVDAKFIYEWSEMGTKVISRY